MESLKILHVTRIVHGGVAVVASNLTRGLDRKRYKPFIVFDCLESSDIVEDLEKSHVEVIRLREKKLALTLTEKYNSKSREIGAKVECVFGKKAKACYFFIKSFKNFLHSDLPKINLYLNLIKKNRIDLVHTHHNLTLCKPEIIAARLAGIPCVSHQHSYIKHGYFELFFKRLVGIFIYISNDIANHFISQGFPEAKGRLVFNGIDIKKFSEAENLDRVRYDLGCKSDELLVGSVGRIGWWKGHEFFIEAMAIALKTIPNLKGTVVGSMTYPTQSNIEYQDFLHALVKSKGLEDKILFAGHQHNMPEIMAAMDVVVHASSEPEPFGLVVIEGMAAKKPVVATAAGGVLDIIENGVNGFLVPCKNSEEMAKTIVKIFSDTKKAAQIGCAARRRVKEMFTINQQVSAVEEIYDSLLS